MRLTFPPSQLSLFGVADPQYLRWLRREHLQKSRTEFEVAFQNSYARKGLKDRLGRTKSNGACGVDEPLVVALSEMLYMQAGRALYHTAYKAFRLRHPRTCNAGIASSPEDSLQQGINKNMYQSARSSYGHSKIMNSGDATRGRRELVKSPTSAHFVGGVYPPDVSQWPSEPGIPIPLLLDDALTIVEGVRGDNLLSSGFDTELFRCIGDPHKPMTIHTVFPEPHSGFTGFFNAKLWVNTVALCHEETLNIVAFCSDCCSNGMSAIQILSTVSQFMLDLGVVYVGLPGEDYDYFAPNLRPVVLGSDLGEPGLLADSYVPSSNIFACDDPHSIRNGRRLVLHNNNKTIVFYSEKGLNGEECGLWASGVFLSRLANDRQYRGRYNLYEMLTFNKFIDQKGDAAYDLVSYRTIKFLEKATTVPDIDTGQPVCQDRATVLALTAMNFASNPWKTKGFNNPFMIVEFVWTAVAIWEMQELYVTELVKRVDLHCPSFQFRETQRINACAATNLCLAHFREKEQFGKQTEPSAWEDLGLQELNQDVVESVHSEERTGNMTRGNSDWSVNMSDHLEKLSRVLKIFSRRAKLSNAGLSVGRAKNTERAHTGKIDLGLPSGMIQRDISYGRHSPIKVPQTYAEFVVLLSCAQDRGYKRGLALYEQYIPETVAQMKAKHLWRSSVLDRPKKKTPGRRKDWLSSGPIAEWRENITKTLITAEAFHAAMPEKDRKARKKWEDSIRAEVGQERMEAEPDAEHMGVESLLRKQSQDLIAKARKDRDELAVFAQLSEDPRVKKEGGVIIGNLSGNAVSWKELISGDCVMDSDGNLKTIRQVLRAYQLRDTHDRDRGKRFWVGRLRDFNRAILGDGHDTTIGTCLLVQWGGSKSFAVVRVMGIFDDTDKVFSIALHPKTAVKRFQVELLDPVAAPTEAGSQRYRGSGFSLPKLAATKVIAIVQLRHLHAIAKANEPVHDALLRVEDIIDWYDKGYQRVTMQEGRLHIETDAERVQNLDSGVMWNATESDLTCLQCSSSWYDDGTGVILKCRTCSKCWHQECHTPKVPWDSSLDPTQWECCVCTGKEKDICCHCRDFWSEDGPPDGHEGPWHESDNNRLMFCDGTCGRLWHQNCYLTRIVYPGDDVKWFCDECQMAMDEEEKARVEEDARRASRLPRIKKVTRAGATKDVTRVDGKAMPGLRIADPAESHLEAATWVTNHTRGGGKESKRSTAVDAGAETFQVGDRVEARMTGCGRGFYDGTIAEENSDGTFVVEFDDGDVDKGVKEKNIRYLCVSD